MATGRIGVTPTLRTRWSDQPATGTTVLSGLDDNSVALVYDAGYEAVYRNGVLLSRGNDYTATDGTTITLLSATLAGDIIEVFANDLVPLTDAISKGQYNAKGALLSATAASTPGVLAVGTNDQVLTADSTASTGLKWATPVAGTDTWTLLNAGGTALTGATIITVSGITSSKLMIQLVAASSANANAFIGLRFNTDSGTNYSQSLSRYDYATTYDKGNWYNDTDTFNYLLLGRTGDAANTVGSFVNVENCKSTSYKLFRSIGGAATGSGVNASVTSGQGFYIGTSAITSVSAYSSTGNFDNGTIYVYGA